MARPDDDDQPWLAEGVREERATLVPRARLVGGGLIAILLAVLVALGVYLASGHKSDGSGGYARPEDAPLIAADGGAYKVQPANPGGAQITGIDDSVAAVAGGRNEGSVILPDEPEEPVARPVGGAPETAPPTNLLPPAARPNAGPAMPPAGAVTTPTGAAAPTLPSRPIATAPVVAPAAVAPKTPKPDASRVDAPRPDTAKAVGAEPSVAKPKPAPLVAAADPLAAPPVKAAKPSSETPAKGVTGSVTLQLGAFSTRDKADAAWATAGGDGALSGLAKRIEPVDRDGTTLYRLRAAGVASRDAAKALCGRIKAAGNACIVAD